MDNALTLFYKLRKGVLSWQDIDQEPPASNFS